MAGSLDGSEYAEVADETRLRSSKRHAVSRPPFGYYGSKARLAPRIAKMLPPHHAWVDAFCGSAAVTFAKQPAPIEIVNDLDGDVVNVFKQLRDNSDDLCRAVAMTPYSRTEFEKARRRGEIEDPVERARLFLVEAMMAVNGTAGATTGGFSLSQGYSRAGREARVNRWFTLPEKLAFLVDRLRGVRVENRDARRLVEVLANRPATLIYLDPPYQMARKHRYRVDADGEEFHRSLLEVCNRAKCMLLISAYDNSLYREMLTGAGGWTQLTLDSQTKDTRGRSHRRSEVLWMNWQFAKARKTGRVPIRLSAEEKRMYKINPVRRG